MTLKDFARGFAWRAALVIGLMVIGIALGLFMSGKIKLPGLGAILGGAVATGLAGLAAARKGSKKEVEELDREVEEVRKKAEEAERAKIEKEPMDFSLPNLSDIQRQRIAQAGRDAVTRVRERQGR